MQCLCGFRNTPFHLLLRGGFVFHTEGDLAVCVHIEKLRPRILEHTADFLRNAVHRQVSEVFSVKQDFSA